MNFELTSFLDGDIENAVQVWSFLGIPFSQHALFFVLDLSNLKRTLKLEAYLQACSDMEQKEFLEELAESVGASAG